MLAGSSDVKLTGDKDGDEAIVSARHSALLLLLLLSIDSFVASTTLLFALLLFALLLVPFVTIFVEIFKNRLVAVDSVDSFNSYLLLIFVVFIWLIRSL